MPTHSRCVVCPDEDYSIVVEMRAIEDLMDIKIHKSCLPL